jgi:hypothetical protein
LQEIFAKAGWSKEDLRRYIMDNCWETAADLKRMGHWWYDSAPAGKAPTVEPADDQHRVYLFKREAWCENDV